ncbi:alpha-1,2-fucosyltransferase [Novosphingobium resinovorum]|uniref:Glycosyl transferase family 11 n=1 Tax=Novosphingobium resinovorum TaxID=158500 RepID=A0A1D8A5H6_9SPHN|nr:alpha-1,2-fucosyltransferase [Novosphingobium resinovorum]AOR77369.1 hypothetical protein BES08_11865 [Novosphingobium resinovorum]
MPDNAKPAYVYPRLSSQLDLGAVRIAGAGLGNSMLNYFEAYLHARAIGAQLIAPAWLSVKIGPIIRREQSYRLYNGLFQVPADELQGLAKMFALRHKLTGPWTRHRLSSSADLESNGKIDVVKTRKYIFENIYPHKDVVRERLQKMSCAPIASGDWGNGDYIAVHVRLGDFQAVSEADLQKGVRNNLRIPLNWYRRMILELRRLAPQYRIDVFSDGREAELAELLNIEGVALKRGGSDLEDMLGLAKCRLLVGSLSTFSYWGAYLGDQPSIWYETASRVEPLNSDPSKQIVIGDNVSALAAVANLLK